MAQRSRLSTGLSGVAGEYFVAAELSRRGYVASLTLRNTRGIDILASNTDATKSVGIQVKANQGSGKEWMLNQKIENDIATNLFFVFIRLNDLAAPEYYIVPRAAVARYVKENHKRWLDTPGRKGQPRQDTPIRKFADPENKYLGKWELLGLD
jgi:hypothetical protein